MFEPTPSEIFLSALTARDFARLAQSLAPSARARFLLPRGTEERSGRDEIADRLEGWFAFIDVGPDGIARIDLICSGFLLAQTTTGQSADPLGCRPATI